MNTIVKNIQDGARQQAIASARSVAEETLETLKTARSQIEGIPNQALDPSATENIQQSPEPNAQEIALKDSARIKELESEIKEIKTSNLVESLQKKISAGQTVYLTDYTTIPIEEKEVLKAQMEAYNLRKAKAQEETENSGLEVSSKPGRRLAGAVKGMKAKLDDLSKRSEIRMSPSG